MSFVNDQQTIQTKLKALDAHQQFLVAGNYTDLAQPLAEGHAVDSIFFQKDESTPFDEIRVWFKNGELFTSPGIPIMNLVD